jgi:hypothetical protein
MMKARGAIFIPYYRKEKNLIYIIKPTAEFE